ncbi:ATP-dependent DNA helicase RecQ [Pseudoalteromonas sp. MMG024]|uniref:RecQ family ATP-dependent DNA helicase n=1 Tax=Pseudoalteromonas sp. MMG024 TaxID=2909980 RepID=UPI001F3EC23E|nr:ATP-dependent DNA helicase RecQ [Pseudoalteromonas sp. MMG024]MCF6456297.1 RecQ family ATP-dependent DNA helicase [Pseudoalteromonas sp. MMG024]
MNQTQLQQALKHHFNFDVFREGQGQTISQLLAGHSSLAVFPTGSGKSLCYQLTALLLPHLTLVVSPLLALMKDQVDFLNSKGIAAASLDSSLDKDSYFDVVNRVRQGEIKILMVSVERFKNERFRQFINSVSISMLVVDEAHCISEWGHNFRPDYLKLPQYREELNIPLVLLLTATATKKVKQDMAAKFQIQQQHIVQTGFYRHNLDLSVIPAVAEQKAQQLLDVVKSQQGCGIVYVTLQQTAESVATMLANQGINAVAYHAGLGAEQRQMIQNQFMQSNNQVVVATIAFGMGIDKSDIRFVVHYDLPKSIENYSQEIGRAGRDGKPSNCFVLGNLDDVTTLENFVYGDTPEATSLQRFFDDIREQSQDNLWQCQIYSLSQTTNIRQLTLKTVLVQCELLGLLTAKYSYFAEYRYFFKSDKASVLAKFNRERQAFLNQLFDATDFKKKWGSIDVSEFAMQSGLDRSRILSALEYLHEQSDIELESKQLVDVYAVNSSLLANNELLSQLTDYFASNEKSEVARINTMLRYFQLDTCLSYNLARYFDDQGAPNTCGHCSVCRGQTAKLNYIDTQKQLVENQINDYLAPLDIALNGQGFELSDTLAARFLTGLTQPVFTKVKASKMAGYAVYDTVPFELVKSAVARNR